MHCPKGTHPFDTVKWKKVTASIIGDNGKVLFEKHDCEFPDFWSQRAINIVASKYFYGTVETSLRQLVSRVVETIVAWGKADGYFDSAEAEEEFCHELMWLIIHQYGAFNSPVWFNVGLWEKYSISAVSTAYHWDKSAGCAVLVTNAYQTPQASACFIQSVDDNMDSIMTLARNEANLFKYGSGSGTNLSTLRSTHELLSGGGTPSGPLSFMRVFDQIACVIKSGGKTRRAAKMQILDIDHPDVMDFITCKSREEEKVHALISTGMSATDAYNLVLFQNSNLSVQLSDAFMKAVANDERWETKLVTDKEKNGPIYEATALFEAIAEGAWKCGDPGVQFSDTINKANTCLNSGKIRASNPCLAGDTMVSTSNGECCIKDLVGVPTEVIGSDGKLHSVTGAFSKGVKQVALLVTKGGYFIKATLDHKFLTKEGDKELRHLSVHDELSTGLGAFTSVQSITVLPEEEVYDINEPETNHFVANGLVVHNCSEFLGLDNSACNLASLNLLKFVDEDSNFNFTSFFDAIRVFVTAQDIIIDHASYPTKEIATNSHIYRPVGLGYTNFGALLMSFGIPYDSDKGRELCCEITSSMQATAALQSVCLAKQLGAFEAYDVNKDCCYNVYSTMLGKSPEHIQVIWKSVLEGAAKYGYRNSQFTVLAPTGTISFMMDCDTTGIEPTISLVAYKQLVGGGTLKLVSSVVTKALHALGYADDKSKVILQYIEDHGTLDGCDSVREVDLPVFDCAFKATEGTRYLSWQAHVGMMVAAQPFISGAISKTVNLPNTATVQDIMDVYWTAWEQGLKAVAVYRDGSKGAQPLSTTDVKKEEHGTQPNGVQHLGTRQRLPETRNAITHKFTVGGHEGYVIVGLYEDGTPGEMFIKMAKEGSTIGGLMDCFSTAISMGLQYGVPLTDYVNKFSFTRFDPMGFTSNPEIRIAKSLVDYIFRWMDLHFGEKVTRVEDVKTVPIITAAPDSIKDPMSKYQLDAPICDECGAVTVRAGSCYLCHNCGKSLGCS